MWRDYNQTSTIQVEDDIERLLSDFLRLQSLVTIAKDVRTAIGSQGLTGSIRHEGVLVCLPISHSLFYVWTPLWTITPPGFAGGRCIGIGLTKTTQCAPLR